MTSANTSSSIESSIAPRYDRSLQRGVMLLQILLARRIRAITSEL
jgi:hypothetical protein